MKEDWKQIEFAPEYEVSTYGQVRRIVDSRRYKAGYVLVPKQHRRGYLCYGLVAHGKPITILAHRLVALTFLGNPGVGYEVAHNDGTRTNNRLDNLRWATPSENQLDRFKHGTGSDGENQTNHKLTADQVKEIRSAWDAGSRNGELSKAYGISPAQINRIVNGQRWARV